MQYLRNQWADFKNSWSCLILTFLWIQRYTMYPLHLNYTTTLPRKTITNIFHYSACIEIKQNMEIWHFRLSQLANSSKPCENSLFEDVFKVSAPAFRQARSILIKLNTALLMEFCSISSNIVCKTLQLISGIWLGLKCLVAFKHSSPDMVIKRIKVWWVRHNYSGVTKKIPRWKIVIFIVIVLHGSVVV